jgi:hypothetical protein
VVVAVAVHRPGHPHDRRADAAGGQVENGLGVLVPAGRRSAEDGEVALGRHPARHGGRPRSGDQRLAGARERACQRLDRARVDLDRRRHLGEVMDVGEVDDRVGGDGPGPQCVQVLQIPAKHLGPQSADGGGRGVGPGEPQDPVTRADELGDDGRSDPAGRAGDEYAHEQLSFSDATRVPSL